MTAARWSRDQLRHTRAKTLEHVQEFTGKHFSEHSKGEDRRTVNMLQLGVSVYGRILAARCPRTLYKTRYQERRQLAQNMQISVDNFARTTKIDRVFRRCVQAAMFNMAIVNIGVKEDPELYDDPEDPTVPFINDISFDDWVHDMSVKRWDQVRFMGHACEYDLEWARNADMFKKPAREALQSFERRGYDEHGEERVSSIATGTGAHDEDYLEPMTKFHQLFFPAERLVIITDSLEDNANVLADFKWEGPAEGPYRRLMYQTVPDHTLPLPPVQMWRDLHDLGVIIWNKMGAQAKNQKSNLVYRGDAAASAERIQDAADMEMIAVDDPAAVKLIEQNGVNPGLAAFAMQWKQMTNQVMGNIEMIGGTGAQSETLGQDEMMMRQSSAMLAEMMDRTMEFYRDCLHDLGFYMYDDPMQSYTVTQTAPGFEDIQYTSHFTPEQRQQADYNDLDMEIEVSSVQNTTPAQRSAKLKRWLVEVYAPFMQLFQMQGQTINLEKLTKLIAQYDDMPELHDVVESTNGFEPYPEGPRGEMRKPPGGVRKYERISRNGNPAQSQDMQAMQQLMSMATSRSGSAPAGLMQG